MELADFLEQKREMILGRWTDHVLSTYPAGSFQFFAKQKDRFQNPVGYTIKEALGAIYGQIIGRMDNTILVDALDGVIRIRSVQEFTPSEAVAFVFGLKTIVREAVADHVEKTQGSSSLREIDARIDQVALLAFDKYMECRETLHEIRIKEIRSTSNRLLGRVQKDPDVS